MVLLLVIAPCKIRNSIESALGVENTTAINKSKASFNDNSCHTIDGLPASEIVSKNAINPPVTSAVATGTSPIGFPLLSNTHFSPYLRKEKSVSPVPYYLLYRQFRAYLT